MTVGRFICVALAAGLLAACDAEPEAVAPVAPVEVSADATGRYCGMLLADHEGPKGQIHLAGSDEPVWFSSVRDTIAFTRLPEESKDIAAIYVNDMGKAQDWAQPEPGTWTAARDAWFVIESSRRGGMGAPEAVPFSEKAAADAFRSANGGRLVRFDDIPENYVLGPVELDDQPGTPEVSHSAH
ncbi:MAG TPA: nitrous oxide reductase accessory protein NosL [Aestuariivirgaceae bacterium]|nr:nitrous oxide reductase accessory protein NosL [Aestuariivirgaceae bacterium]